MALYNSIIAIIIIIRRRAVIGWKGVGCYFEPFQLNFYLLYCVAGCRRLVCV